MIGFAAQALLLFAVLVVLGIALDKTVDALADLPPFLNFKNWQIKRHDKKLAARLARGHDRYFEELRTLRSYDPAIRRKTPFTLGTCLALAAISVFCTWLGSNPFRGLF